MNETVNSKANPRAATNAANDSFARDERGQISVLVVLAIAPFVLLVAFVFNSGVQTSRKIEMQGAADAAAVASAVTVARGMNFIVLNNNAMAEVLSLMIAVRCIRNVTHIMAIYVGI
jgi:Flp pilus assembly protein TadG